MKYYGTKNNKDYGFFLSNFYGAAAVEDEIWELLLKQQSEGAVIQPDSTGYPIAIYETPSIEDARSRKLDEIKKAFEDEINNTSHLTSSIDGFEIDARRVDSQNITMMIEYYVAPIPYKGYTSVRENTTLEELKVFKQEIYENGTALYAKKWALEEQVAEAATPEEVGAISWDSSTPEQGE